MIIEIDIGTVREGNKPVAGSLKNHIYKGLKTYKCEECKMVLAYGHGQSGDLKWSKIRAHPNDLLI